MTRLIPLFILVLLAALGCDSGPDFNADIPGTGESVPEIDAYARAFMAKWDVPGASCGEDEVNVLGCVERGYRRQREEHPKVSLVRRIQSVHVGFRIVGLETSQAIASV